jgi:hypothetical protein
MPKVIGRSQNTRRELKCQKIKTENMKNLITKARKGESTKRKRLKRKAPGGHLGVDGAAGFEIAFEENQLIQHASRTRHIPVLR